MKKEEILNEVKKYNTTVLSFPNRGPWSNSCYRGNCSGWIHAYFICKYGVNWKDVVMSVIRNNSGTITNEVLYNALEEHKKAKANKHWKAKVRQTLQLLERSGLIIHPARGCWCAA